MDLALQALNALAAAVLAVAAIIIARELRGIRERIDLRVKIEDQFFFSTSHTHKKQGGVIDSPGGYAIYVYRRGDWHLEADLSAAGHEPSAPRLAGSYEGQVIKKESTPEGVR